MQLLVKHRVIPKIPLQASVAAVSVGLVNGELLLDLCYDEDFRAQADFNVVFTDRGELIELQGATEAAPFPRQRVAEVLALAAQGVEPLFRAQRDAIRNL